ncbi:FdtA/QdtA family cupin domain-containing protein [bacterium]|nr:FdtA/QdtA family cupin domain-containing protein [bacterium]
MSIRKCKIIKLPKIQDARGNLTFIENHTHIPFAIQRIYYLYDVPGGESRASHAHKSLHQLFIALSGSFDILLKDGSKTKKLTLNRSYVGLYVPPMIWRRLINFSSGSVCCVLASQKYDESDYYRDWNNYVKDVSAK